jgi:hypothetical protein
MELRIEKEIGRGNLERASEISDKLANALKERGIKIDDTTIVATKFSQHPIWLLFLPAEINAAKARKEFAEKIKEDEEKKQKKPKLQWTYVIMSRIRAMKMFTNTDLFLSFETKQRWETKGNM